jgi:hypothetical protein
MRIKQTLKHRRITMKSLINLSLAAALVASSVVVTAPEAMARKRHHQSQDVCLNDRDVGGIVVLGLLLGAVTGGVGSAIAYGGAYAVGGAALGGAGGALFGAAVHGHHNDCA